MQFRSGNGMDMQSVPANDGAGTGLSLSYPSRRS